MTENIFSIRPFQNINFSIPPITTWILDPPYNVGFKYDNIKDNLPLQEYNNFIESSSQFMFDHSTPNSSLFLIHYKIPAARLIPIIESSGWVLHQWISWVYPHNMGMSKKRFTQGSRAVLWFTKGTPNTHIKAVPGIYKNPNDSRIKQRIAEGHSPALMDWWHINLRKNVSKGHRKYANQLPYELLKRIILTTSSPHDYIGDIMAGSGTTLEVSQHHNRNVFLNDINPKVLPLWTQLSTSSFEVVN